MSDIDAFPHSFTHPQTDRPVVIPGMSLRDYFAAHAPPMPHALREMANVAARQDGRDTCDCGAFAKYETMWRWIYADAMLKERAAK